MSLTVPPPTRSEPKPALAPSKAEGPTAEQLDEEHRRKLEEVKRIAREAARGHVTGKLDEAAKAAPAAPSKVEVPAPKIEQKPEPAAQPQGKSAAYPVALPSREKRDTKKLMKSGKERETSKIKEFTIPVTEDPTQKIEGLVPGAKTLFIPKPEAQARREQRASRPELASMAQGPGGDTLAVGSKEMMKEIEEEYEKSKSKGNMASLQLAEDVRKAPVPVDKTDATKTPPDMPVLPDQETVKKKPDGDEDMDFIIDDNYAFFTPPPPTRKDKGKAQDDVIDAGDLLDASDKLPPEKQAQEPPKNDKTVNE
jgi:hypothetical protein